MPRLLEFCHLRWNFQKSSLTKSAEVLRYPHYCIGIHPFQARSSKQSALLAHSADCCYYPRLSSRCENLHLDSDFPLPALALVHCFRGGITGHAYAVAGEDVPMAGPEDVAGSSVALYSECIDRKAV
jgi:hypothetical protein